MLNIFGLVLAATLVAGGLALLDGPTYRDTNQTGRILIGAALVSLGCITALDVLKDWYRRIRLDKLSNDAEAQIPEGLHTPRLDRFGSSRLSKPDQ